jgi:hypothetical protein
MNETAASPDPTPPDCFPVETLQVFQSLEGEQLSGVNYFLWLNRLDADAAPYRFLYMLELEFEGGRSLMLSSGDDSEAIVLASRAALEETARQLQELHGVVTIQQVNVSGYALWQGVTGRHLEAVRLSKNEAGLYHNDALLLDFGTSRILVSLAEKEGLAVSAWE